MAGRPVSVSAAPSGLLYGVITFAILFMVALGLFIFMLVNYSDARQQAESARLRMQGFGNPPSYYADEAKARNSNVFAVVDEDLRRLAKLVSGNAEAVGPTVVDTSDKLLADVASRYSDTINPSDTLLTVITKLDNELAAARSASKAAEAAQADARAQNEALTAQLKSQKDEFEAQVQQIGQQLEQARSDMQTALQEKDTQINDLQTSLGARETQLQKLDREGNVKVRDLEITIGQQQNLIADLRGQIKVLKPTALDPDAILKQADGKILRAVPGSEVVYIDLGAKEEIKVGMGFEVFERTPSGGAELRGKASIQVMTIMQDTAECRVTRGTPGRPIVEGDIIVNIAYDQERKPKFVIRGDFDLNYDGKVDADGLNEVAAMVRQYGGQVVDELNETVDYVIIGRAPFVPEMPDGRPTTDIVRDQRQQRAFEASQFADIVSRAQQMYIPVITQSQFLFLIADTRNMTVQRG